MELNSLPLEILVDIFHHLPLKEQIRNARVNKFFREISDLSISRTKTLNEEFIEYAISIGLKQLLIKCSTTMERIIFGDSTRCCGINRSKIVLSTLSLFTFPRVVEILFTVGTPEKYRYELLNQCPNLKILTYEYEESNASLIPWDTIIAENLKKLIIRRADFFSIVEINFQHKKLNISGKCNDNLFSSIIKNAQKMNLAIFQNSNATECLFDDFFKFSPNLHSLEFSGNGFHLKHFSRFWQLSSLTALSLDTADNFDDTDMMKIAYSFPDLETLILMKTQITGEGVSALAGLNQLRRLKLSGAYRGDAIFGENIDRLIDCVRLYELDIGQFALTSETFVKLVRSLPELALLKFDSIVGVQSSNKASEILHSFSDLDGPDLAIQLERRSRLFGSQASMFEVWDTNEVKEILQKGLKKKIQLMVSQKLVA